MDYVNFNNLPLSVISPKYSAYDADTVETPTVPRLAMLLFSPAEKRLKAAIDRLVEYDEHGAQRILEDILAASPKDVEACLLAGMLALRAGQYATAAEFLETAQCVEANPGVLIRRLVPTLRIMLRIGRFQFFPVYPDYYGVAMMLALALWRGGKGSDALQVLKELRVLVSWRDEMRLLAGEIYLAGGDTEAALEILSLVERSSRDELDVSLNILRALAEVVGARFHRAAITLRGDAVYSQERNPFLTTVAKFIYSHALEEDGLPVLALRESTAIRLKHVLNPELRKYVLWRELQLKGIMDRLSGDALLDAAEFKWLTAGEKVVEQPLLEVVPQDAGPQRLALSRGAPKTLHERLTLLEEMFREARKEAALEEEKPAPAPEPEIDFTPSGRYDWSLSLPSSRETCFYDFRGTRKAPEALTASEERLKLLEERALYAAVAAIVLLFLFKGCF